jgi:hypothetical protein
MKKLFTVIIILGISMMIHAQDVKFGLKGGVNFATFSGKDVENVDSKTAFHVGVLAEIPLLDKFSLQPELLYSVQGIKENDDIAEFKLNYLQLPLIGKYYVTDEFSLEAGPQVGFLLSAKAKVEGEGEGDIKDDMNKTDFGLNFGLGYTLGNRLNVNARYNFGLSKIYNKDTFLSDIKAYNSVIQVSVGYIF